VLDHLAGCHTGSGLPVARHGYYISLTVVDESQQLAVVAPVRGVSKRLQNILGIMRSSVQKVGELHVMLARILFYST
jgi:hypothetical protein